MHFQFCLAAESIGQDDILVQGALLKNSFQRINNYFASLIYQVKMASSLLAGCKNQLIIKYCSKFLVSSICQNIFITYIKKSPLD